MLQDSLVLTEFKHELSSRETWRIDCLGDVRHGRTSQNPYLVDVFLSPLRHDHRGVVTSPDAVDQSRQKRVALGVGYLPILHPGLLVREGAVLPVSSKKTNRVRIEQLVDPGNSSFVALDVEVPRFLKSQPSHPLLFPSEYRFGKPAWPAMSKTRVLAIPDAKGVDPFFLLVPCIEVLRFFFCPCSILANYLFHGGWEELIWEKGNSLANMPESITVGSRTTAGLTLADHKHLAFLLTSEKTRIAVAGIHQKMQRTSSKASMQSMLECPFPFDEQTHVTAEVVEIPTGTSLQRRYFVTRLVKCARPIPFKICFANPMLNSNQGSNADSPDLQPMDLGNGTQTDEPTGGRFPVPSNAASIRQGGLLGDDLGKPSTFPENIVIRSSEDRFEGFNSLPVELAKKDEQSYRNTASTAEPFPVQVQQGSTQIPSPGTRPVIHADVRSDVPVPQDEVERAELYECVPDLMQLQPGCVWRLSPRSIPTVHPKRSQKRSWAMVQTGAPDPDGTHERQRQLWCLFIKKNGIRIIVADIERRPSTTTQESFALAAFLVPKHLSPNAFLEQLARLVSLHTGWPDAASNVNADHRQQHLWGRMLKASHNNEDTPMDLAQRINSRLLRPILENAS